MAKKQAKSEIKPLKSEIEKQKVKKVWKVFGYIVGWIFDIETLLTCSALFLSTLVYEYNLTIQGEIPVVVSIPQMLITINGLQAIILMSYLYALGIAFLLRVFSYFAKKRKVFSLLSNAMYLTILIQAFYNLDKTEYFTIFLGLLILLYLSNTGKILFDFGFGIYQKKQIKIKNQFNKNKEVSHVNKRANSKLK